MRRFIGILCYYLIPFLLIGYFLFLYFLWWNYYEFSIETWWYAWWLLVFLLFLKPISKIFSKIKIFTKTITFRKQLWVLMFWLFITHATWTMIEKNLFSLDKLQKVIAWDNQLFWWILAWIIIFILWITSNKISVKILKRSWKKLHYLAYLAFIFTALHIYFINGEILNFIIVILFCFLKILEYFKIKIY